MTLATHKLSEKLLDMAEEEFDPSMANRLLGFAKQADPENPSPHWMELLWALNEAQYARARKAFANLLARTENPDLIARTLYQIFVTDLSLHEKKCNAELENCYGLKVIRVDGEDAISLEGMTKEEIYMLGLFRIAELEATHGAAAKKRAHRAPAPAA